MSHILLTKDDMVQARIDWLRSKKTEDLKRYLENPKLSDYIQKLIIAELVRRRVCPFYC